MIKQIFTWWNSQTLGTFLYTLFNGKRIKVLETMIFEEYDNFHEKKQLENIT